MVEVFLLEELEEGVGVVWISSIDSASVVEVEGDIEIEISRESRGEEVSWGREEWWGDGSFPLQPPCLI